MTVFIGYMRISKANGSQTLDSQKDALLAAGIFSAYNLQIAALE